MANYQFDEYQPPSQGQYKNKESFIVEYLISWGIVNTKQGAYYLLLAVSVICLVIAVFFFAGSNSGAESYGNYEEMRDRYPGQIE